MYSTNKYLQGEGSLWFIRRRLFVRGTRFGRSGVGTGFRVRGRL